jgi:cyclic pyranopterin phosphate synthase
MLPCLRRLPLGLSRAPARARPLSAAAPGPGPGPGLTHIDSKNRPSMVNIVGKAETVRTAHARCYVLVPAGDLRLVFEAAQREGDYKNKKGPILSTAVLAGIMGAKKTSDLIPLCHPLPLQDCALTIEYDQERARLQVDCIARTSGKTGVEMEALVGVSTAALCIYDMCKGLSHDIVISDTRLMSKTGGKRDFHRPSEPDAPAPAGNGDGDGNSV